MCVCVIYVRMYGRTLHSQRVEILSLMQRYGEALDILINELGDMEEAVRFTTRCHDDRG